MQFFVASLVLVSMQGLQILRAMKVRDASPFMMKRGGSDGRDELTANRATLLPKCETFSLLLGSRIRPAHATRLLPVADLLNHRFNRMPVVLSCTAGKIVESRSQSLSFFFGEAAGKALDLLGRHGTSQSDYSPGRIPKG